MPDCPVSVWCRAKTVDFAANSARFGVKLSDSFQGDKNCFPTEQGA